MKRVGLFMGRVAYWVGFPLLWIYLRGSKRTRVLIICDEEFLVLRGWLGSSSWSLPGGGLHKRENSLQGLIREVQEETGIELYEKDVVFLFNDQHHDKGISFTYDCFVVHLRKKPVIKLQKYEIADYAWVPLAKPSVVLARDAAHALARWQNS